MTANNLGKAVLGVMMGGSLLTTPALAEHGPRAIEGGQIVGVPGRDSNLLIYRGIPYAAPPVGNLRWRAPQPVKPWEGIKTTATFGPACVGRNFGSISARA